MKNSTRDRQAYRFALVVTNSDIQVVSSKEVKATLKAGETQVVKATDVYTPKNGSKDEKDLKCFTGACQKKA